MFKKIFSLFKKKEEVPTVELEERNVLSWLDAQREQQLPNAKERLKEINTAILQHADQTKQALVQLHNAQLQNPNIPDREKHFMTGNRETYIKRTQQFLQQLQLLENIDRAEEYFSNYSANVSQYEETTKRPFHIVSQFFKNEVFQVTEKIKNIDTEVQKVRDVLSTMKYEEWKVAKQDALAFFKLWERQQVLAKEAEGIALELQKREQQRLKEEEALEGMRKTAEYAQVNRLKEHVQDVIAKIKQKKLELQEVFAQLEQGLKKYARVSFEDEKIILNYLDDPLDALQEDKHMRICMVLQNMKLAIQNESVQMKPDKREKTIQECDRVTKDYLSTYMDDLVELKKQEQEVLKEIKAIPIMQDIAAKKKDIEAVTEPVRELQEKLDRLRKEQDALAIDARRESLAARVAEYVGTPVVIHKSKAESSTKS